MISFRLTVSHLLLAILALGSITYVRARDLGTKPGKGVPQDSTGVLRVQVYLDTQMFCPGKVDGSLGEFTYKAVVNYNYAHGVKDIYDWSRVVADAAARVPQPTVSHEIRADVMSFINADLPEKPADCKGQKYMAYRSLSELIAERFHTDESFLQKLNPRSNIDALQPGDVIVVPNVQPFRIESVKKYQEFKEDPALSKHIVVIDTHERMGAVYDENEKMLAAFPITPGKPQFIPRGQWKVVIITTTPDFRYDKKFLEQGTRGAEAIEIPPGPNSPVGILWAGLSKSGIGLHGTASPRTIGRAESAGCVRFANWDAIRLPTLVRPGAAVIVR